jgi:hypothetical protein
MYGALRINLENRWDTANPVVRGDSFVVLDRAEFAWRMLEAAMVRGASMQTIEQRPALIAHGNSVVVEVAGRISEFDAAVDATGRAAIWSRPIKRTHQMIAEVFEDHRTHEPAGLKLVRSDEGWAYCIGLRDYTTVATLSAHRRQPGFVPDDVAGALGISSRIQRSVGSRIAGVQWSTCPIMDRTIAIGDAALTHDPISGQGIRFALASAIATAAVIRTWRRSPDDRATPTEFYVDFVKTERMRHLRFIRSLYGPRLEIEEEENTAYDPIVAARPQLLLLSEDKLCFSGRVESAPIHIDGFIERGHVIRLRDGGRIRWLGGFDLLRLRELTNPPVTVVRLMQSLRLEGFDSDRSASILDWCLANGILCLEPSPRSLTRLDR